MKLNGNTIAVVPDEGFESDAAKNPYIAYNCLHVAGKYAVVGNGTHVDPISQRLETGMQMRDALLTVLHDMDFEHDDLRTPRIAGAVDIESRRCSLGIVRHDALVVQEFSLDHGEAFYVATYEHNYPGREFHDGNFDVTSADEACDYILGEGIFRELQCPISAACAIETEKYFALGCKDVKSAE